MESPSRPQLRSEAPGASPPGGALATSSLGALTCLSLAMLMPSLDTSIANVGLPALGRALGAPFHQIQWIVLSYLLAITTLVVGAGRLGDLIGRRRLLQLGVGLFTGASLACGLAATFWQLVLARAVQGAGAAIMMALTVALVGDAVPKERTGSAMGLLGTMSAIGTTLGPSLGGVLIAGFGWRAVFLVNVPLGVANILLARRFLPATPRSAPARPAAFDVPGTLLLGFTLAAYALAVTAGGRLDLRLLLAAVAGGGLFVAVEARASSPLVRVEALRGRGLGAGLAMNATVAAVMMTTLVVGPFYLSRGLGLPAAGVGLVMSVGPCLSIASGVPAGRIVDRLGAPRMVAAALAGMAVGALALSTLPARLGIAGYLASVAVLTPGYQLFQAANGTMVMAGVPPEERGVTSGLLGLSRNLGLVTGAAVMGALFASGAGTADLGAATPAAVTAGLRITFTVAAGLLGAAAVVAARGWTRRAPRDDPGPQQDRGTTGATT